MPFREDGKYYLMMGYDVLRDLALEIGRRLEIGDEVFLLTLEEMLATALDIGLVRRTCWPGARCSAAEKAHSAPVRDRQRQHRRMGSPPKVQSRGGDAGLGDSPGGASGPARIVRSPSEAGDLGERYILVCPSTDPSWNPLFTNAAGLILECGGTLSTARSSGTMSIPAVVLRDACTILHDGKEIIVDGRNGTVSRAPSAETAKVASNGDETAEKIDPHSAHHRALIPPPGKERWSAKIRNATSCFSGACTSWRRFCCRKTSSTSRRCGFWTSSSGPSCASSANPARWH